jgi:hypothetical protein
MSAWTVFSNPQPLPMGHEPERAIVFPMGYEPELSVWIDHGRMVIDMNDVKLVTLEQLRGFLAGTSDLGLISAGDAVARYRFIKVSGRRSHLARSCSTEDYRIHLSFWWTHGHFGPRYRSAPSAHA